MNGPMNRRTRRAAAKGARPAATADTPAALYEAGLRHFRAGRRLDAQLCCQKAIALDAAHADALHLMGRITLQAGHFDHAVEWLSRTIRQNPTPGALADLASALQQQGR